MLLSTYQPICPDENKQNPQYDCFREKLDGEYPIFCFPARTADEFRFRSLLAAPCKPERLIVFDTDDYVRFDAVAWNNILTLPRDDGFKEKFDAMFEDVDERFSEYVIQLKYLEPSNVKFDIDIRQLVEADTFCLNNEGAGMMMDALQEQARATVRRNLPDDKLTEEHKKHDLTAMLYQTAFIHYLAGVIYALIRNDAKITPIDLVPFMPDEDNELSLKDWQQFNELRSKVFDTDLGGSHREYIEMCEALEKAVGIGRMKFLKSFPRNGECPCGSGKKFKKCHGLKPVELFPF